MKNKLIKTVLLILVIVAASTATYFTTKHYVFASAYGKGKVAGAKLGFTKGAKEGYQTGWQEAVKTFDTATCTPIPGQLLGCQENQTTRSSVSSTPPTYVPPTNSSIHCTTTTDPTFVAGLPGTSHTDCY